MTMDITSRRSDLKTDLQITNNTTEGHQIINTKTIKRPFDVAFLMLPDDKLKQKQNRPIINEQVIHITQPPSNNNNEKGGEVIEDDLDFRAKSIELQKIKARHLQNALSKQQVFGDPTLVKPRIHPQHNDNESFISKLSPNLQGEQKSAFTKVNLISKESRESPSLSASPDVSYQNSLSPSPPIATRNFQPLHPNMLSPTNHIFKTQNLSAYQSNFIQENLNNFTAPPPMPLDNPFMAKTHPSSGAAELLQQSNFVKMRPMLSQYRQELSYNYAQFQPPPEMLKIAQPDLKFPPEIRNPAAALLSTLLPPSLAALSLPAQNICAKCNISFRMTSDLVYHMRSHHKNDALDITKKRREEKLKCPVCAESFRERHHLTRHMTAHQDKDEDEQEPGSKKKELTNNFHK